MFRFRNGIRVKAPATRASQAPWRPLPRWYAALAAIALISASCVLARAQDATKQSTEEPAKPPAKESPKEPSKFSLVVEESGVQPQIGLGDSVRIHIDGDTALDTTKIGLRL